VPSQHTTNRCIGNLLRLPVESEAQPVALIPV
jgi:hypothetical protein